MKTLNRTPRAVPVLVALALLLAAPGCEKTEPTADSNSVLVLSANPGNINFGGEDTGESVITANLYSSSGTPQSGIGVRFSTDIGTMKSGGESLKTDGSGVVQDTLTVTLDDEGSFAVVTARSSSVTATVDVAIGVKNLPPDADIFIQGIDFEGNANRGDTITYDGSGSEDPEDGRNLQMRWVITSTDPSSDQVKEGHYSQVSSFFEVYDTGQDIQVSLTVEDTLGQSDTANDNFTILDNRPPTADAGADKQVRLGLPAVFDASGSSDSDGVIVEYEWDWGDGLMNTTTSPNISHVYTAANVYCARLVVTDDDQARSEPDWSKVCVHPVGEDVQPWCTDPVRDKQCF